MVKLATFGYTMGSIFLGGKFEDGAVTGVFSHGFNHGTHNLAQKWANPTNGNVRGCDPQGCGSYGANRRYGPHQGTDYEATPGQDVYAVTDGTISKIGYPYANDLSYRYIKIDSPNGFIVRQLYVKPITSLKVGTQVSAGQVIGTVQGLGRRYPGITDHVHVDIKHNGASIDPASVIP